mmetsp:Transcript_21551/g.44974  ORF Transcript_21551/g.44974 Transcript_21551/m.44974 type:complete len:262 (+) Transcript_21551:171-956(+)
MVAASCSITLSPALYCPLASSSTFVCCNRTSSPDCACGVGGVGSGVGGAVWGVGGCGGSSHVVSSAPTRVGSASGSRISSGEEGVPPRPCATALSTWRLLVCRSSSSSRLMFRSSWRSPSSTNFSSRARYSTRSCSTAWRACVDCFSCSRFSARARWCTCARYCSFSSRAWFLSARSRSKRLATSAFSPCSLATSARISASGMRRLARRNLSKSASTSSSRRCTRCLDSSMCASRSSTSPRCCFSSSIWWRLSSRSRRWRS